MERQQNTQLHTERAQNQIIPQNKLKSFNIDSYLSWLSKNLVCANYFIFDTGVYIDIGANQLEKTLASVIETPYQKVEEIFYRSKRYFEKMINLVGGEKRIIVNNHILNELRENLSHTRFLITYLNKFNLEEKRLEDLWYNELTAYSYACERLISLLYSRQKFFKNDHEHSQFMSAVDEILNANVRNYKVSVEDESVFSFFVNSSLEKPTKLISNDRDLRLLYDSLMPHLTSLKREHLGNQILELRIKQRDTYVAKDEIDDSIRRGMVFSSYLC